MVLVELLDYAVAFKIYVRSFFKPVCNLFQYGSHGGVQKDVGDRDSLGGTDHAVFELVPCKRDGAGTVAVGKVLGKLGKHGNSKFHKLIPFLATVLLLRDILKYFAQLFPKVEADDGRGRLRRSQTMVIASCSRSAPYEGGMFIQGLDEGSEEEQELDIVLQIRAGR